MQNFLSLSRARGRLARLSRPRPDRLALISAKLDERLDGIIGAAVLAELAKIDFAELTQECADSAIEALDGSPYSAQDALNKSIEDLIEGESIDLGETLEEIVKSELREFSLAEILARAAREVLAESAAKGEGEGYADEEARTA